jgi:uncharacterized membrane protein
MKTQTMQKFTTRYNWDRLRVSFWFAPAIMSIGALLLVWAMNWLDVRIPNEILENSGLVLVGTVAELSATLIGMATSILATAGVVFSLLTLPLSTVASQYGSRLLRVFLGDRITQLVLGIFASAFVYCLGAVLTFPLRMVPFEAPQITPTVGLVLMMAAFASLILLVQHISTMLQAPNIAAGAGAELLDVILAESSSKVGIIDAQRQTGQIGPDTLMDMASLPETVGYQIRARQAGYIQYIQLDHVLALANERNLLIHLLCRTGQFISSSATVALVWPASGIDEQQAKQIRNAFLIGNRRTPAHDVEYAFNQLVEMAVRAMSPAINDPFTAITCLEYIGAGLALFLRQGEISPHFYNQDGQLRFVFEPVTFDELLSTSFDMLRHASCENVSVLLHMLDVIDGISRETKSPEARQQLLHHVSLIQAESQAGALIEQDRQRISTSSEALQTKLKSAP